MMRLLTVVSTLLCVASLHAAPVAKSKPLSDEVTKPWEEAGGWFSFNDFGTNISNIWDLDGFSGEHFAMASSRGEIGLRFSEWNCKGGQLPAIPMNHYFYFESVNPGPQWTERLTNKETVVGLFLHRIKGTNSILADIGNLPNLETLAIQNCDCSPEAFGQLSQLKKLKILILESPRNQRKDDLQPIPQIWIPLPRGAVRDKPVLPDMDGFMTSLSGVSSLQELKLNYLCFSSESFGKFAATNSLQKLSIEQCNLNSEHCRHLGQMKQLTSLNLSNNDIGDKSVEHLGKLTKLQKLNLFNCQLTDKGLHHLNDCADLRELNLSDNPIEGHGFTPLTKLSQLRTILLNRTSFNGIDTVLEFPQLERLELNGPAVCGNGLQCLRKLKNLKRLDMEINANVESDLEEFRTLKSLEYLSLNGSEVANVDFLRHLTRLKELHLSDVQIYACQIEAISTLANLETLSLSGTPITDEDLKPIGKLKNLVWLRLTDTYIQGSGLKYCQNLDRLESLSIGGLINDDAILYASQLKNLKSFQISTCDISMTALSQFSNYPKLELLILGTDTISTEEIITELRLPGSVKAFSFSGRNIEDLAYEFLKDMYPNCQILIGASGRMN